MAEETKSAETTATTNKVDYEGEAKRLQAELETEKAEKAKLKIASDNASKEAAEYKRKEKERMTAEEQEKAKIEEQNNHYKQIVLELSKTKAESVFAKKGWEEKEYTSVIETLAANVAPEKMAEVANAITELVGSRETKIAALTRADMVKNTDNKVKSAEKTGASDYKAYQEEKKQSTANRELKFD